MDFNLDDIQQLSPDEASLKAAKGLLVPAKWPMLGTNAAAIWGECQGSGKKPYQVQVDKSGPAFKCSCPSRKFPCKHGLALLLLKFQHGDKFNADPPPAWVEEWLQSRQDKAEKKATKKIETEAAPPDLAARNKREETRKQRMLDGLQELELWLKDQIRQGLARLSSEPAPGQQLATRMVDAQLPGIAMRIRQWPELIRSNPQWSETLSAEFGQLQLLVDAFRRIELLPETIQADLQAALGNSIDKQQVLSQGEILADQWLVLGQHIYEEERLWVRRVWLRAKSSQRFALLLDFNHGNRQFQYNFSSGKWLEMTLAFYPGNYPLRALLVDTPKSVAVSLSEEKPLAQQLQQLSERLAANPWQWPQPLVIRDARLHQERDHWQLLTPEGFAIPLLITSENRWQLLAEGGGKPLHIFAEWQNNKLRPLSAWREQFLWSLAS
ncbi:MAG TPA: SWIM zinc finger family protein [Cellvibrio sp.]|nr:SWIM zinc finger family protein [Cellvibrio sp.]